MSRKEWEEMSLEEILKEFRVNEACGLSEKEARRRLEIVGPNQIDSTKRKSMLTLFLAQFSDFMVIILFAAALISALLTEYADAITILVIVIINALLGFGQEYRAEKSLEQIKRLAAREAQVKRAGLFKIIPARDLVPGDLVLLKTGDIIPADLRLLAGQHLEINEAILTGESLPVKKRVDLVCPPKTALGERKNMAYQGTVITRGKGLGIVVGTGMDTEMGLIAESIQEIEAEPTPLQKRLAQVGHWLVLVCLLIVGVVVFLGLIRGESVYRMVLTGVSLAVAAIPEGLPAIVTVVLALGVQKMVKREAIVRSLPAVETLGCATVICADKTGTLTQNEMTVRKIYLSGEMISFTGEGYVPQGKINYDFSGKSEFLEKNALGLKKSFQVAALCNNALLKKKAAVLPGLLRKKNKQWQIMGDPTEGALLVAAAKAGYWREQLEKDCQRVAEIPFEAERKRMSVLYQTTKGLTLYTKGAPDLLLDLCTKVWWEGEERVLTSAIKHRILAANEKMASGALRVIGLAYRFLASENDSLQEAELEQDLIFVGLAGMIDPPRESAKQAIKACQNAGIKTVMITGDQHKTAEAIARELRIINNSRHLVLSGNDLDELSDQQLKKIIDQVVVYARVAPQHKLRVVKMLKRKGHIVAMTGDGVNDAPAVKEADIGISMGISGTDVTREASSLILANDDFATIVAAVEEGRIIYDNIRKFIRYLLSCNMGEVLTMFGAALMGLSLPLLPIQILWINLVTDGLPAMALGLDPGDPGIMKRRPRSPQESIFAHGLLRQILTMGSLISISTLLAFIVAFYWGGENLILARTIAFTTLVVVQLLYVFPCRSEDCSPFEWGVFSNPFLVGAVICSFSMQLVVLYVPFFQRIFKTLPLQLIHWGLIFSFATGIILLQRLVCTVKIKRKSRIIYLRS